MAVLRIAAAARLLGVSDDTLRRWIDAGRLESTVGDDGRQGVDGAELARFSVAQVAAPDPLLLGPVVGESARNRLLGLVTRVVKDGVMAQVELQAGPFRMVSLMSAEAATQLALEPGVVAIASVKATQVVVEVPRLS